MGMRGISSIVAIILMLMITTALTGFTYMFILGYLSVKGDTAFELVDVVNNKVTLMNLGSSNISSIRIWTDGEECLVSEFEPIKPGAVGDVVFAPKHFGKVKLTVQTSSQTTTYRNVEINLAVYKSPEYELFSNLCSEGLYVLENERIKFFTAAPRVYRAESGSCVFEGDKTYRDEYSATPMRIWAKNSDSQAYRHNNVILDDTIFQVTNWGVSDVRVSDESMVSINPVAGTVTYLGDVIGNLEPKIVYKIFPNSSYVQVVFSVKNIGSITATNYRLRWRGELHPPAGNWRNGEGRTCSGCPSNVLLPTDSWSAFIPCTHDDVFGIVVEPTVRFWSSGNCVNPWFYMYEESTVDISPGETHVMRFYIVSDLKGPEGNEWAPVEDVYNEFFS